MNQTVIVFQEDCILAAAGREGKNPVLTRAERIDLQGFGDSFARWQDALVTIREKWNPGPVRLVLPADMSATRILQIPGGSKRQLAEMAQKEVRDSFRNEIADYSIVHKEKKGSADICAGGVDSTNLERFAEICKESGISVSGITVPMEGYLRILKRLDSYRNRTAIYLFFEEGSMTSVLCQNGRYLYSTRSRLFSEPGTLDFGTEIVRSISGILQFYAAGKRDIPITEVYYAGCQETIFEVSVEGIHNMQLEVFPMELGQKMSVPSGEDASDWLPCLGALIREGGREKRINLHRAGLLSAEEEKKAGNVAGQFLVPGILFGVCLIATGFVAAANFRAEKGRAAMEEWIEDPEIQEQYQEALSLQETLQELKSAIGAVERASENLSVYPDFSSDVFRKIENVGGMQTELLITGYDTRTGILTFDASSRQVIDIPDYILKLQNTGLFHTVDYTGYVYENEWYILSLSCTLEGKIAESVQGGGDAG